MWRRAARDHQGIAPRLRQVLEGPRGDLARVPAHRLRSVRSGDRPHPEVAPVPDGQQGRRRHRHRPILPQHPRRPGDPRPGRSAPRDHHGARGDVPHDRRHDRGARRRDPAPDRPRLRGQAGPGGPPARRAHGRAPLHRAHPVRDPPRGGLFRPVEALRYQFLPHGKASGALGGGGHRRRRRHRPHRAAHPDRPCAGPWPCPWSSTRACIRPRRWARAPSA